MPHVINGVSTNPVPTGITVPSDNDGPGIKAADVGVPFQALLDGEANLDARVTTLKSRADANDLNVGQLRYLNWPTGLSVALTSAFAAWDAYNLRLLVAGTASAQSSLFSVAQPASLSADFLLGVGAGELPIDLAVDTTGHAIVMTGTRYIFSASHAAAASKVDVYGAAITVSFGGLCFDPVNNKWVWLVVDSGSAVRVRTSLNITSWAAGTPASGWSGASLRVAARPDIARVMAVGLDGGTTIYTMVSTDGGTTWALKGNQTTTITGVVSTYLTFDNTAKAWYFVIASTAALGCEVWRSVDDGSNWTKMVTLANGSLGQIAIDASGALVAPCVIGSTATRRGIAISTNNGASWSLLGVSSYGAQSFIGGQALFNGSQFITVLRSTASPAPVAFSLRTGTPALNALT